MENELRQATTEERRRHEWYKVLVEARSNPEQLLSLPSFTEVMPTLSKLKDSLLASQVQTAQLLGNMTAEHPHVRAAKASQAEITRHFEIELTSALRAAELDWRLAAERVERLKTAIPEMRGRLDRLASLRSEYSRRYNEVENRTKLMNEAQRELVDARAVQTSAEVASLITRVDTPLTGPRPQGPGKTVIMASGVAGGMIIGLGVLLLSLNTTSAPASIATQELRPTHNPSVLVSEPTTSPARGYSLGDALRAVSQSFAAPSHHAS
jgi:uncharacterized protein involved in exopolysaccharide biosynthesis